MTTMKVFSSYEQLMGYLMSQKPICNNKSYINHNNTQLQIDSLKHSVNSMLRMIDMLDQKIISLNK